MHCCTQRAIETGAINGRRNGVEYAAGRTAEELIALRRLMAARALRVADQRTQQLQDLSGSATVCIA
jgi:hypothetical protein